MIGLWRRMRQRREADSEGVAPVAAEDQEDGGPMPRARVIVPDHLWEGDGRTRVGARYYLSPFVEDGEAWFRW